LRNPNIATVKTFKIGTMFVSFNYYYYLLTAIGLSLGGSSPTLVQTKIKIHKTTITTKKQNIKQQNNYKTIKISTQTEHSKCKYYKNTHTHTYCKTYEIKTTIADDT
jgi:Na+/H+-dicarboxylate symporter